MGNTHDTEIARIEADYIHTKWRTTEDYRWGYSNDRGPETWWVYYPSASGGNQSPIDIITEEVTYDPDLWNHPLQIYYRNEVVDDDEDESSPSVPVKEAMSLVNTGNTARINVINSHSYITGGPCKDHNYVLEQIHLHWGEDDNSGSEHLVNTHSHAAELHMVHWNEDLYDTYEEAVKREDGVVIIAVFLTVSEDRTNRGIHSLSSQLQDIQYREQSTALPSEVDARWFLPDDRSKYWTYKGSFTTPPCFETVTWILLCDEIPVSSADLEKFRQLRCYCEAEMRPDDEFDGQIVKNCRTVQPIGTRKIYTAENLHDKHHHDDDPFRQPSTISRLAAFPDCVRQCGRA